MQFILLLTSILGAVVTNAQSLSMMSLLPDIFGYEMSLPPDFELGSVSMLAIEPGTFVTEAKATKTTKTTKTMRTTKTMHMTTTRTKIPPLSPNFLSANRCFHLIPQVDKKNFYGANLDDNNEDNPTNKRQQPQRRQPPQHSDDGPFPNFH